MKLKDIGNLIVFDTFPLLFEPKQKIILTHLLHLEKQTFPVKLPMIFTTQKLADQLRKYCEVKNHKCINKSNIVIVKPYEFIDIVLERRLTLQILFCTSEEEEMNNILVLIRQNGKLNFIYGGNYTDIRSALLNDIFASWISNGVEKLYVNLKRMEEDHKFGDVDQIQKVFKSIQDIIKCHRDSIIHIHLPLFGYEDFILKLARCLPKRINCSNLSKFYFNLASDDPPIVMHFLNDNDTDSKIVLFAGESTHSQAEAEFKKTKAITINIFNDAARCESFLICSDNIYYELFYSPEPSPFNLKLLCMLVKPKHIFAIVDTFNNKSIVPKYLYELCVGAKEKMLRKQKAKSNDSFGLYSDSSSQKPVSIIGGALPEYIVKKSGPYLSDSESDDND